MGDCKNLGGLASPRSRPAEDLRGFRDITRRRRVQKPRRSDFAPEPARGRPPRFSGYHSEETRELAETSEV
ncbi:hypothetical protein QUF80_17630 [Desulfococcaceae bacterium HSG8]|nr:hypothetical protein [Desulfococcaceae bacterium HSG8]